MLNERKNYMTIIVIVITVVHKKGAVHKTIKTGL